MRSRLPLFACLLALTLPAAADRLLLPPLAPSPGFVLTTGTDGVQHLGVVANGRFLFAVLFDANGEPVSTPVPLPFESVRQIAWAGNYIVFSADSFVRFDRDGMLLDEVPRALPSPLRQTFELGQSYAISNGERVLARGTAGFFFIDADGNISNVTLPYNAASVHTFATDGERFALLQTSSYATITMINGRGDAMEHFDRSLPHPVSRPILVSDGRTWAIFDRTGSPHFMVFDLDFRLLSTSWASTTIEVTEAAPIAGGGYAASMRPSDSWGREDYGGEFRPPSYKLERTVSRDVTPGPQLKLASIPQRREKVMVATNDEGMTLVSWLWYAVRVAADGTVLDREPLAVPWACQTSLQGDSTAIVSNGRDFVIASTCSRKLATGVVRASGEVVQASQLDREAEVRVSLVFDGTKTVAFWTQRSGSPEIMASVLDESGNVVSTEHLRSGTVFAATATPDGFLFLYGDFSSGEERIYAETRDHALLHLPGATRITIGGRHGFEHELIPAGEYFLFVRGNYISSQLLETMVLDRTGRIRDRVLFPSDVESRDFLAHCDGERCTLLARRELGDDRYALDAWPMELDADGRIVAAEPVRLVETSGPHAELLAPLHFRGTLDLPRLWYTKMAWERGVDEIHVLGRLRSRAVRH